MSTEGICYEWDQPPIMNPNEGGGAILLPAGDYTFQVTKVERSRYTPKPGAKTPASHKAVVHMEVYSEEYGVSRMTEDMILHSNHDWKLCQFFGSIGLRKHNGPLILAWPQVAGRRGILTLKVEKYTNKNNEEREVNRIERFIYEEDQVSNILQQTTPQQYAPPPVQYPADQQDYVSPQQQVPPVANETDDIPF